MRLKEEDGGGEGGRSEFKRIQLSIRIVTLGKDMQDYSADIKIFELKPELMEREQKAT
jgi:hypothetical protein